jgi:DNA-binding response OmpR family regulator
VARILIAEDDPRIAHLLEKGLQKNGYATAIAEDGEKAQSLSLTDEFDLLILDMGLPKRDGFHVLQDLRSRGKTLPVLVLTGRSERDVVMCLRAGADDYMRKPFRFDELLARVETRLRNPGTTEPKVLSNGRVALDVVSRTASLDGRPVDLSARELALLETLMRHAGQVMDRGKLLREVWGYSFDPTSNIVDVYVNTLRTKLGGNAIETVPGSGYRLRTH